SQPFSLTIGMQAATQTGGTVKQYDKGVLINEYTDKMTFKKLLQTIIPTEGDGPGNYYKQGNSVGSWDVRGRWRFNNDTEIIAYYESPFEDGSGIGKLNGFDGLYGLEYKAAKPWYISSAVIEYFDFCNQGGPIHFDSNFNPCGEVHRPGSATGKDDYYNNFQYSGYQYFGMSIGTPVMKSSFYNLNGSNLFLHNRVRGFHVGLAGTLYQGLQYRALLSWRTSLGSYDYPLIKKQKSLSAMLELHYDFEKVKGLRVKAQIAGDKGELYGNNFGALLGVSYTGLFNFSQIKKK
ncbi:MAG: capsule assembly Wzi family protein, partial [Muribaculaceae bacterium]|nr:capsule assembly Wzi family protein [Muribaculaceae bacterium]